MYDIVLEDGKFWISYNGRIVEEIGSFIEPITPLRIIKEINDEI